MRTARLAAAIAILGAIVACHEPLTSGAGPLFSTGAPPACPSHVDFLATDQASLVAALSAASPGDTIGVDGMIVVTGSNVIISTDAITITCASPGSGLRTQPGSGIDWLLGVFAHHVTVERLVLDGTNALDGAYLAYYNPDDRAFAGDVRLLHNTVTCGAGRCALVDADIFAPMHGALVADNTFTSDGSPAGVQLQGVDSGRVERNTVVANTPSTVGILTNLASSRLVIVENAVLGPWETSLMVSEGTTATVVQRNNLSGATSDPAILGRTEDVEFLGNTVQCADTCLFANNALRTEIADNSFQSAGSATGVHLQGGIDGSHVERNTIIATASSTVPTLGGIRIRDGANVVVADNVVRGPWTNSIATTDLTQSRFEGNSLDGALFFGMRLASGGSFVPISMTDNLFRGNRVTGAGSAGMFARLSCRNTFLGNNLQGNAGNLGAVFDVTTGANTLVGNGTIVVDNGSFDCNGDGVPDPNLITGAGAIRRGASFAPPTGGAVAPRHGIVVK